jgi:hypothetical protein
VWLAEICHSAVSILPDWQLPGKMAEFLRGLAILIRQVIFHGIGLDFIGLKDWINNNNIYWKQLGLIL